MIVHVFTSLWQHWMLNKRQTQTSVSWSPWRRDGLSSAVRPLSLFPHKRVKQPFSAKVTLLLPPLPIPDSGFILWDWQIKRSTAQRDRPRHCEDRLQSHYAASHCDGHIFPMEEQERACAGALLCCVPTVASIFSQSAVNWHRCKQQVTNLTFKVTWLWRTPPSSILKPLTLNTNPVFFPAITLSH